VSTPAAGPEPTVVHDEGRDRYLLRIGEDEVGHLTYRRDGSRVVMEHTVVDPDRREKGLGGRLVQGALDDVRTRGLRVVPQCPFVSVFLARHDEYADLVDEAS
jgi:predicted GNAT family acetyltransferase